MDYNEILKEAAGLMGPYCKACPVCNGRACGNCVPGPGSRLPGQHRRAQLRQVAGDIRQYGHAQSQCQRGYVL